MNINPKYLKDAVTAEIVLRVLLSAPEDRLSIVNTYMTPIPSIEWIGTHIDFVNAAAEAVMFMNGKPRIEWLNENERGFDLLERITGYRP